MSGLYALQFVDGQLIGGRDHSTVIHAFAKIEQMYKSEPDFRDNIDHLTNTIRK